MWLKTIGTAVVVTGIGLAGAAFAASNTQSSQNGAYCLQKLGQTMDCKYASLAACNKDKSASDACIKNTQRSTTGSGMQSPKAKSSTQPKSTSQPMAR